MNKSLALLALVLAILLHILVKCNSAENLSPSDIDESLSVSVAVPMG